MRRQMVFVLGSLTAVTAACATPQSDASAEQTGRLCDAAKAQDLVGQLADGDLAARAMRLSGAASIRWLRPGQIVTMEYRADRLNIQIDDQNKVVAIRCG